MPVPDLHSALRSSLQAYHHWHMTIVSYYFENDSRLSARADLLPKIMNIYIHRLEHLFRRIAISVHSAQWARRVPRLQPRPHHHHGVFTRWKFYSELENCIVRKRYQKPCKSISNFSSCKERNLSISNVLPRRWRSELRGQQICPRFIVPGQIPFCEYEAPLVGDLGPEVNE